MGGNSNVCPKGTIRIGAQGAFLQHDCSVDTDSTQIYCSPHLQETQSVFAGYFDVLQVSSIKITNPTFAV